MEGEIENERGISKVMEKESTRDFETNIFEI